MAEPAMTSHWRCVPIGIGVPARQRGWVSRHGHRLPPPVDGVMRCPESGWRYQESDDGIVRCLDRDEDAPLEP